MTGFETKLFCDQRHSLRDDAKLELLYIHVQLTIQIEEQCGTLMIIVAGICMLSLSFFFLSVI